MKESMSSHSSRESLNSRESKENTPRHSRESTPQHQIKGSDPEFKKPQPIGIKNNRRREEMGVLGHNNNSNIKSNNDLGGSCGSLSSNHSTGTGLSILLIVFSSGLQTKPLLPNVIYFYMALKT